MEVSIVYEKKKTLGIIITIIMGIFMISISRNSMKKVDAAATSITI